MEDNHSHEFKDLRKRLGEQEKSISADIAQTYASLLNMPIPTPTEHNDTRTDANESARYIEAIRRQVADDYDPLTFDQTKNYFEAISAIQQDIEEVEKNIDLKVLSIDDLEADIQMHNKDTKNLQQVMDDFDKKASSENTVTEKQLLNAKNNFKKIKTDLQEVIQKLYPSDDVELNEFLNVICEKYFEDPEAYVEVNSDVKDRVIETLLVAGIIEAHPSENNMYKFVM